MGLQCIFNVCYQATFREKHWSYKILFKVNGYDYACFQLHLGKYILEFRAFCFTLAIQSMPGQYLIFPYLVFRKNVLNYIIPTRIKAKLVNIKFEVWVELFFNRF